MTALFPSKSHVIVSPPAILRLLEILLLLASLILFAASGECSEDPIDAVLFLFPTSLCFVATLVSYITSLVLMARGANPLLVSWWVKADVAFSVAALMVLLFGVATTTTNCSMTQSDTIAAAALSLVVVSLYACSAALTWLLYKRQQQGHQQQVALSQKRQSSINPFV